mmetsp:Transcript_7000/g.19772  ORF Transcript_7000/g.19772 Transcript_7000/m.19772 type:complete len:196 (-) Transcript_7000:540-1127(-)
MWRASLALSSVPGHGRPAASRTVNSPRRGDDAARVAAFPASAIDTVPARGMSRLVSHVQASPSAAVEDPKWFQRTIRTLDTAANCLKDHAEAFMLDGEESCHGMAIEVLDWFVKKKGELVQGCESNNYSSEACDALEGFGRLITDMSFESKLEDMFAVLCCQYFAEKGAAPPRKLLLACAHVDPPPLSFGSLRAL